jgi:hypothetical protein
MGAPRPSFLRWVLPLLFFTACGTTGSPETVAPHGNGGPICGINQRSLSGSRVSADDLRASELVLRVVDHADDHALTDVPLRLEGGNEVLGALDCQVKTDRYGVAQVRVLSGLYKLSLVNRPDLVARTTPFYTSQNEPREIRIEKAGVISGRVVDDRGKPIPHVVVTVSGEGGLFTSQTDASGAFRCDRLWSGEHTVSVVIEDRASVTQQVVRAPGQDLREVNLTLVPGAVLVVRATCGGPCVGATVSASIGDEVREERVGPDGIARLHDLPPGQARLHGFRDDARGRLRATAIGVTLQAGRTVNATLDLGRKRN